MAECRLKPGHCENSQKHGEYRLPALCDPLPYLLERLFLRPNPSSSGGTGVGQPRRTGAPAEETGGGERCGAALPRRNAPRPSGTLVRQLPPAPAAPATVTAQFSAFLGLADNFPAVPPDT